MVSSCSSVEVCKKEQSLRARYLGHCLVQSLTEGTFGLGSGTECGGVDTENGGGASCSCQLVGQSSL